ncbi:protein of unknown function [Pustulibacterium marinum]|uniref:DUF3857 domain-containing protein n=1 Tax=Pustulibacterium marinum TaxID=1224947 RepID=A0A1I7IL18_9FLAO|nr:DUF3857 domain-containing protein [Pustulibacterium marinum]SFU73630.1 protein of unknown function [Pustulibacterium marinum]
MKQLSFILAVLISSMVWGQDYEYGKVTREQLTMESYSDDPEAEALVLYESGKAEIFEDYEGLRLYFTFKTRIKIFDKEGFDHATFEIPLYTNDSKTKTESLEFVRATSYNMDTPPTAIGDDDVLYEKYNSNYRIAKFTIPKTKEGTVFDVEYRVKTPFYFYNFHDWKFQSDIPKLYSQYITKIPANYKYNAKIIGALEFDEHTGDIERRCVEMNGGAADCEINKYVMKNIPAFKTEDYMTSKDNFISQLKYEIKETQNFHGVKQSYSKSWKDIDHEIKTSFDLGKQARKERAFSKLIPEHLASMPKGIDKAKAIYYHLQKEMNWNGENHILSDVNVKEAFENKKGNIAELNLVLLNMLKASDFEAYMVLAREREDGFPTLLYPVLTDFNYLFIKLVEDGKTYYLDISDDYLPFGMLPLKALNNYGRVIDFDNESYWDNIYMNSLSMQNIFMQYQIDSDGYMTVKKAEKNTGFLATRKRKVINKINQDSYLKQLEDDLSAHNNAVITSYKNSNAKDSDKQLQELFEIEYEDPFQEQQLFFNPLAGTLFSDNPFKLKERNYPVDFGYPRAYIYKIILKLDDAYQIKHLPENVTYNVGEALKLDFKTQQSNGMVTLDIAFYIKKAVFTPEEYQDLKKIFSEIVDITNNADIIIEKSE